MPALLIVPKTVFGQWTTGSGEMERSVVTPGLAKVIDEGLCRMTSSGCCRFRKGHMVSSSIWSPYPACRHEDSRARNPHR